MALAPGLRRQCGSGGSRVLVKPEWRLLTDKRPQHSAAEPQGRTSISTEPIAFGWWRLPTEAASQVTGNRESSKSVFENSSRGGRASPQAQICWGKGRSYGSRGRSPSRTAIFQTVSWRRDAKRMRTNNGTDLGTNLNKRIEPVRRSGFRLVPHSGSVAALLLMAHPGR